jgi:hypothetical protein
MITHFPNNPMMNLAGVFSFTFIPYHLITSLPAVQNKVVTESPLFALVNAGYKGYSTLEELEFIETAKEDENGTFYQWEINGFMPGDGELLIPLMEYMETCKHLVIIKDAMDQQRIVGMNSPLNFTAVFKSGSKAGEARGYKYSFTGPSISRAPIYRLG